MVSELQEIIEKYPVKNEKWIFDRDIFVADISDFGNIKTEDILDPWNRRFNLENAESDLDCWILKTTVEGKEVICKLFND